MKALVSGKFAPLLISHRLTPKKVMEPLETTDVQKICFDKTPHVAGREE